MPTQTSTFMIPVNTLDIPLGGFASGRRQRRKGRTYGRNSRPRFWGPIEIVAGLKANDQVIVNPPDSIVHGTGSPNSSGEVCREMTNEAAPEKFNASRIHEGNILATAVLALALSRWLHARLALITTAPRRRHLPAYKKMANWKTAEPSDQNLAGKWWEIFQDAQLNELEEQIEVSNQNLKAAYAQYQQARAVLRYYRADYYPTVTAAPSAARTQYSNNRPPLSTTFSGVSFNDFVVPIEVSYEADIWGRVRRTVESSAPRRRPAPLISHSSISTCMPIWRRLLRSPKFGRRREAASGTVVQYENALELNEDLYQGGLASDVEVQQAKTQLETTRAQAIDVGVVRAQYEHAVAVLVGSLLRSSRFLRCR